jgi:hypothetical protein
MSISEANVLKEKNNIFILFSYIRKTSDLMGGSNTRGYPSQQKVYV